MSISEIPKSWIAFGVLAFALWTYIVWTQGTFNGMSLKNA